MVNQKTGKERRKTMIPKIKKILYATDLSANSAYVFRYAINSAMKHDADIIILHVFERIPASSARFLDLYLDEEKRKNIIEEKVSDTMARIRKRLKLFYEKELKDDPAGIEKVKSIEVCEGFPAEVILKKADALDCDAIVLGAHGKGIIANTFLGSTSKRVLRRTRKPVFIIPLPKGELDITFHDF
jgi:nucleotide-binding universal stress UspA family protein